MNYGEVKTISREVEDITFDYILFFQKIESLLYNSKLDSYISDEEKTKFNNFLDKLESREFKIIMNK